MPYDKDTVENARQKGIFEDNVFDSNALMLNEEEKNKIQSDFTKNQKDLIQLDSRKENKAKKNEDLKEIDVELNFFEKIFIRFLSYIGLVNLQNYKLNKAVRVLEKNASKMKPPIYNISTGKVSKYFAYQLHNIYLNTLTLKKLYQFTFENTGLWNDPGQLHKTGVEILFETLAKLNMEEIDNRFSAIGISKTIMEVSNINNAIDEINSEMQRHINSIEKNVVDTVNKAYTNIIYVRHLTEFDFVQFFKRFDSQYSDVSSQNFTDIPGESLTSLLFILEEILLQIDLYMDNVGIFKKLDETSGLLADNNDTGEDLTEGTGFDEESELSNNIENDLSYLFEGLKDLLYKNCFTLLLRIIKRNPSYTPSILHTNYDLYKIYCDTFVQRMKNIIRITIKEKKQKKIEESLRRVFDKISWAGTYGPDLSDRLEENSVAGLSHIFQLGLINTFFTTYYSDIIKQFLNLVVMNGIFIEKHQQKNASEFIFLMEKFEEKFHYFHEEMKPEGSNANRLFNLMTKKEGNMIDYKKNMERLISNINGKAKELFDEFCSLYTTMSRIIGFLYDDINLKTPKYIRNIHYLGGLKNTKIIGNIEKSFQIMLPVKEIIDLMRD